MSCLFDNQRHRACFHGLAQADRAHFFGSLRFDVDLIHRKAQRLRNLTLDSVTIYSLTLLGYFAMALVLASAIRLLERHLRRKTMAGGFA